MDKTATATVFSGTGRPGAREAEQVSPGGPRDRLKQAEAEWHALVEGLERQRSTVRSLASAVGQTTARLAHASHDLTPGGPREDVGRLRRQLRADQAAYDRELKSYEHLLSTAEDARTRLHGEMTRLREELHAASAVAEPTR